jgi:hypothetical protein
MLGLSQLRNAVQALADSLMLLSQTVAEANAGLRGRLGLDDDDGPAALPPASSPRVVLPGPDGDEEPSGNGNGRKRKARAE